jgi:glycosyltransferase involved in cell wall biosynthesis
VVHFPPASGTHGDRRRHANDILLKRMCLKFAEENLLVHYPGRLSKRDILMHSSDQARTNPSLQQSNGADLSIIIPCFNESEGISRTVAEVEEYIQSKFSTLDVEIILINDGSTDSTGQILDNLESALALNKHHHRTNRGRGAAIRTGIAASTGALVICLDADLSYDTEHIGEILEAFSGNPGTDTVVVSAYMKGGIVRNVPWRRLFLSRAANWILSRKFKNRLSTVTCVVRGYKGALIRSLQLSCEGKELHLEILFKIEAQNANILEIPGRLNWSTHRRRASMKLSDLLKHLKIARLGRAFTEDTTL